MVPPNGWIKSLSLAGPPRTCSKLIYELFEPDESGNYNTYSGNAEFFVYDNLIIKANDPPIRRIIGYLRNSPQLNAAKAAICQGKSFNGVKVEYFHTVLYESKGDYQYAKK